MKFTVLAPEKSQEKLLYFFSNRRIPECRISMLKVSIIMLCLVAGIFLILMGVVFWVQDRLIFFPEKVPVAYRYPFQQPFKEIYLNTPDGNQIHALHFKAKQPKGVMLYFHGNAGSLRSWGYLAEELLVYGYDVFMPDYRSFGKSTGKLSPDNLYQDAQLTYDYLRQSFSEEQIIIFGRSIGTGVATKLASDNKPKQLLLETPFYNFADVAKTHYPYLPVSALLKYTFRSDKWIKKVSCQVYIFHGTADEVVPFSSGKKLAQLLNNSNNLVVIKGGGHNNLSSFPVYREALARILK
ncbi:alpha/beta hydrolase [Adhaeribacter rhizoryzae]|uniref:alpha/beta hydrolase n=1 Tax=Adhaeribacter rhizoryzae TaxID=2607907 RepID=UPI001CC1DC4B|nr:alpha/beta hydrolase [Adhaeribacter rhizoryzae]